MIWTIDGTDVKSMSPETIELRGIEVDRTKYYSGSCAQSIINYYQSWLNMTANCINNFTAIQCVLSSVVNVYQETSSGFFQVQGTVFILLVHTGVFVNIFARLLFTTAKHHSHWTKLCFIALGCIQC